MGNTEIQSDAIEVLKRLSDSISSINSAIESPNDEELSTFQEMACSLHEIATQMSTLNERKIGYANGIALIGTFLVRAFHEVCSQLKMSDEKSRKAFSELLDTMKLRLKEWPNDIIEEGDNETTDAN